MVLLEAVQEIYDPGSTTLPSADDQISAHERDIVSCDRFTYMEVRLAIFVHRVYLSSTYISAPTFNLYTQNIHLLILQMYALIFNLQNSLLN
jgi:hypothetical protein